MSSLFNRTKDFTRTRKSQSDSPPSSPSPTAKTLRKSLVTKMNSVTMDAGSLQTLLQSSAFLHERLSRLDSGGSSLSSTDSAVGRVSAYSRRENRLASLGNKTEEENEKDFKKLYESAFNENEKLKTNLREAQLELVDIKNKLERVAKKQDQSSSQAGLLDAEKREKKVLEQRMSEMEDELKVLTDLKSDNQRLKDENGALIRVISKLSK